MNKKLLDLIIIIPVYNEENTIIEVINSWIKELSNLNINFKLLVINDGSKDKTSEKLSFFKNNLNIEIINNKNKGHGPTILEGYTKALPQCTWVFQVDSDDEMKAKYFNLLWQNKNKYKALFGYRQNRNQTLLRKFITLISRLSVSLLFGKKVKDVNVPYRLIQSDILTNILPDIPQDSFAPNTLISAALNKLPINIYNTEIPHFQRAFGQGTLLNWKALSSANKSFMQLISFKIKCKCL